MENGCQLKMVNRCFYTCMKSISITISEIIFSLLGAIINSISVSFLIGLNKMYPIFLHYIILIFLILAQVQLFQ